MKKIIFSLCLLLFASCNNNTTLENNQEKKTFESENTIVKVKYGTSFGYCIGYCKKEIVIENSQINFTKSAWNQKDKYPDVNSSEALEQKSWDEFVSTIDLESFFSLEEKIGCPDCADGGSEWIEISTVSQTNKVIFEYGKTPKGVEKYISFLKSQLQKIKD